VGRKVYPSHIARIFPDGEKVEFRLVAKGPDGGAGHFYIMRDKVSIGLYRRFADARPDLTRADLREGADERLPMTGVTLQEAYDFAQWLGVTGSYEQAIRANLPTTKQWDKAAGLFDQGGREGPYAPTWAGRKGEIAINRREPMPVGSAKLDESWCGCRDLAGNGFEWTRNGVTGESISFPLPTGESRTIELRGQPYDAEQPLKFIDLQSGNFGVRLCDDRKPGVSFRVVLDNL
jgi:formylglycine-generating enzyme required for sulfatase activity